jgi:DNA invertase Pin-like site-specific DNA recombinase
MAGLARARKHGTKTGNPFGRPKVDAKTETAIKKLLLRGVGSKATAAAVGVGVGTVIRLKHEFGIEVQPRPEKMAELAADS